MHASFLPYSDTVLATYVIHPIFNFFLRISNSNTLQIGAPRHPKRRGPIFSGLADRFGYKIGPTLVLYRIIKNR